MKEQILKFNIDFESPKYADYSGKITFTLSGSPNFSYGNGTCVTIEKEHSETRFSDTRYTKGITTNFEKWCREYLIKHYMPHTATLIAE